MALLIGIDLCQNPLRVGGSALGKYFVGRGSKGVNLSAGGGDQSHDGGWPGHSVPVEDPYNNLFPPKNPSQVDNSTTKELVQCFQDARQVCKFNFGSGEIKAAVVVIPNNSSRSDVKAIEIAGSWANVPIQQIITENTAVAAAYAVKTKLTLTTKLCIVSDTGGILDVSLVSVKPQCVEEKDYAYTLLRHDVHRGSEEGKQQEKKHSGGGLLGVLSTTVYSTVNCVVEASPITTHIEHFVYKSLESFLGVDKTVKLVFVGKAAGSEKLQEAVKGRFPQAEVWKDIDEGPEDLAAYGAAVLAAGQKPVREGPKIDDGFPEMSGVMG